MTTSMASFIWLLEVLIFWDAALIMPHRIAMAMPQEVLFPDDPQLQRRPQVGIRDGPATGPQSTVKAESCSASGGIVANRRLAGIGVVECDIHQGDVKSPGDDSRCTKLFAQGPCPNGHWVVLSNNINGGSTCAVRHCGNDAVLMGGQCYKVNDNSVCPPTMILQTNEFGIGDCDCPSGTIYHKPTNRCYTPYTKGPCQPGYIIKIMKFDDSVETQCVINPCPSENMVPLNQQCIVTDRTSLTSQCHTINTPGPCSNGILSIDDALAEPSCSDDSNRSIFGLGGTPCRPGLRQDRGRCRQIFGRPGSVRPGSQRPGSGRPGNQRPGSGRPGFGRPGNQRPGSGRPGFGRPTNNRPASQQNCGPRELLLGGQCITMG